jgi:sugar-phosphatase
VKAAIFDMDGLLIDSEPLWRRAEREIFASVGLELTDDDCRRTTGLRSDEVVDFWFERHPWSGPDVGEVHRRLDTRVTELIRAEGQAMPGVRRAIETLRDAGLRLALASSSAHELITAVLATLGQEEVFEVVASGADEPRGKPDPAVYLQALRQLGLPGAECVAFEDSAAGVAAAKAAGIFTIAVPDPAAFAETQFDLADLKLHSLADFDLSLIRGLDLADG